MLGPSTTNANFATPAGVSKVRRPPDQISIRWAAASAASVLPAAIAAAVAIEPATLAPAMPVVAPAIQPAAKIAGQTR